MSLLTGTGVAAAGPFAVQLIAARSEPLSRQASIALALTFSAYVTQLTVSLFIEAPLADAQAPRPPRWLLGLGIVGSLILMAGQALPELVAPGLLLAGPALETGRSAGVIHQRFVSETIAAASVLTTTFAALALAGVGNERAWWVLGVGYLVQNLARGKAYGKGTRLTSWRISYLLLLDTGITGMTLPSVMMLLSVSAPDEVVVGLRVLLSLGMLLAPALGFVRLRLLAGNETQTDRVIGIACIILLSVVIVAVGGSPFMRVLFASSWTNVSWLAVILATGWKVLAAFSTFPFAALRRAGRVGSLVRLRVASSGIYLSLAGIAVLTARLPFIVGAFAAAEAITCLMYAREARR